MAPHDRRFDVVLFGATGFTGRLVAAYLAKADGPQRPRFALAGRSEQKLAAVRDALALDVPLLVADSDDDASLRRVARETRVVLSTVGPYQLHGMPLVDACVAEATDYVDITGEPEFVGATVVKHQRGANAKRLRIVSCCGFDSIPPDLGALFTVQQLAGSRAITLRGHVRVSGGAPSGGTWNSALLIMSRRSEARAATRAALAEDLRTGGASTARSLPLRVRWEPRLSSWAVPLPTIDPQIVLRSARRLPEYGHDFRYGHFAEVRHATTLVGAGLALPALLGLAQSARARALLGRLRPSGAGPTEAQRERARFRVTFFGETDDGEHVTTRVSGGEAGYTETAKMVAESALCLALDRERLPDRHGVLTPAVAMGDLLRPRIERAGIRFEVLSRD